LQKIWKEAVTEYFKELSSLGLHSFGDMTMYQLVAGPNVSKQCSGFKTLGSNYPI